MAAAGAIRKFASNPHRDSNQCLLARGPNSCERMAYLREDFFLATDSGGHSTYLRPVGRRVVVFRDRRRDSEDDRVPAGLRKKGAGNGAPALLRMHPVRGGFVYRSTGPSCWQSCPRLSVNSDMQTIARISTRLLGTELSAGPLSERFACVRRRTVPGGGGE